MFSVRAKNLPKIRRLAAPDRKEDDAQGEEELRECVVSRHEHDWRAACAQQVSDVINKVSQKGIAPNPKPTEIVDVVHRRCVVEREVRDRGEQDSSEGALLRLVRGLPGSGKSKVLEWLRKYFETVWTLIFGNEFVFLAPLNSMPSNMGGFTLRAWGEAPFEGARRTMICSRSRVEDDWHSSMLGKCGTLRSICIVEVEATGAETAGKLEGDVRRHRAPEPYRIHR